VKCNCMGCRGECEFDHCSVCGKVIVAGHHEIWDIGPTGVDRVCRECADHGVMLWCGCSTLEHEECPKSSEV
jgi:hypothetical protein